MPVVILANRNDLCHPFAYGEDLHAAIPGSVFVEIPDKDRDSSGHRQMINRVIREHIPMNYT